MQTRTHWVRSPRGCSSSMHILCQVPRKMVVTAHHEADLFALALAVECVPIVLYEAMASRASVASTDVGDAIGRSGGIVQRIHGFRESMRGAAANADDWRRLGARGRAAGLR